MKIFLHTKNSPDAFYTNEVVEFSTLPRVGEHVVLKPEGPWYEVGLVAHVPFSEKFKAEVYALKVDDLDALLTVNRVAESRR
jgi:hypothetical protein